MNESRQNYVCFILCILSIYVHFFTNLDLTFQNLLFVEDHWLIAPDDVFFNFVFYIVPKVILVTIGLLSLSALILNLYSGNLLGSDQALCIFTVLISLTFYPILINLMKDVLRQPCPRDLLLFGGHYNSSFLHYLLSRGDLRCFPGAHASAPFSLLALKYFFKDPYDRGLFLMLFLPISFLISLYQVFRGVHFLTDILFTAVFSQIFVSFIYYYLVPKLLNLWKNPLA